MPGEERPGEERLELYLGHMFDMARKVAAKVEDKSRSDFEADENLRYTLAHLLQIIGEAALHVPPAFRKEQPTIPWAAIIGMRHRLVHDYLGVDEEIVWKTASEEMAELISELEVVLGPAADLEGQGALPG